MARPADLGLDESEASADVALTILDLICPLLGCGTGIDRLVVEKAEQRPSGWTTVRLSQMVGDIPVLFSDVRVHLYPSGAIRAVSAATSPATSVTNVSRNDNSELWSIKLTADAYSKRLISPTVGFNPVPQYPNAAARDATVYKGRIYHLGMVGATPGEPAG